MISKKDSRHAGVLLHAKHAYMPNNLGYCGPDDRGKILQAIHESAVDERLLGVLKNFEAAYPFIHLIGKSTARDPFDYSVTEAYWIGNRLLHDVSPTEFYEFTHRGLQTKMRSDESRKIFSELNSQAIPHHSFYVLSIWSRSERALNHPQMDSRTSRSLEQLMDNCRISWGRVIEAKGRTLKVQHSPLKISDGKLALSSPVIKKIEYDAEVPSFRNLKAGDHVSIHWNFACEVLTPQQLNNIKKYTLSDVRAANRLARPH